MAGSEISITTPRYSFSADRTCSGGAPLRERREAAEVAHEDRDLAAVAHAVEGLGVLEERPEDVGRHVATEEPLQQLRGALELRRLPLRAAEQRPANIANVALMTAAGQIMFDQSQPSGNAARRPPAT